MFLVKFLEAKVKCTKVYSFNYILYEIIKNDLEFNFSHFLYPNKSGLKMVLNFCFRTQKKQFYQFNASILNI